MWDRVVAPTVAKKYAERCNINNDVCNAFHGEVYAVHMFSWYVKIILADSTVLHLSPITFLIGDPNNKTINPDKLATGIKPFIDADSSTSACIPIYDFLAWYVRKLHSDCYIKKTLKANPPGKLLGIDWTERCGVHDLPPQEQH